PAASLRCRTRFAEATRARVETDFHHQAALSDLLSAAWWCDRWSGFPGMESRTTAVRDHRPHGTAFPRAAGQRNSSSREYESCVGDLKASLARGFEAR